MATVTTPAGDRIEGVEGSLLEYYRGEANTVGGYTIEDADAVVTSLPRAMGGDQDEPLDVPAETDSETEATDPDAAAAPADPSTDAPVVEDVQPTGDTSLQLDDPKA